MVSSIAGEYSVNSSLDAHLAAAAWAAAEYVVLDVAWTW